MEISFELKFSSKRFRYKQKLKEIILSQYRSQRAFAGILTGRKNLRPDNLKSTTGNSRLITSKSFADLTFAESNSTQAAVNEPSAKIELDDSNNIAIIEGNKNFQHKLMNLKDRYTHSSALESGSAVEAFLIMTGEVNFLERHVIAFVRLMDDDKFVCKFKKRKYTYFDQIESLQFIVI